MSAASGVELVVLVDERGEAIGTAPKATVHHQQTPLHLAFSCYVFDHAGRLLLSRRALHKPTWPGAWTNSFCGHPAPGEDIVAGVRRRAQQELGIELDHLQLTLPRFRYDATMANGVRENELCPVFTATTATAVAPDPAEVDDVEWVDWTTVREDVAAGSRELSPWCVQQLTELAARQSDAAPKTGVLGFTPAPHSDLPAAARA